MNIFPRNALRVIYNTVGNKYSFWGNTASILGFISVGFSYAKDKELIVIISISFFCLMLLLFTFSLIRTIYKLISINQDEFTSRSTFIKYETIDSNYIVFESFKQIQVKKPIAEDYSYSFKWSGTKTPEVTSDLQKVFDVMNDKDPSKYDSAILKFQKPIYYNDSQIIHFKANCDDSDHKSGTYIADLISNEVDIIHYRIILKYKKGDNISNAILERRKKDSIHNIWQRLEEIPFDNITKSYEYHLLNPEIGYIYNIRWNR